MFVWRWVSDCGSSISRTRSWQMVLKLAEPVCRWLYTWIRLSYSWHRLAEITSGWFECNKKQRCPLYVLPTLVTQIWKVLKSQWRYKTTIYGTEILVRKDFSILCYDCVLTLYHRIILPSWRLAEYHRFYWKTYMCTCWTAHKTSTGQLFRWQFSKHTRWFIGIISVQLYFQSNFQHNL